MRYPQFIKSIFVIAGIASSILAQNAQAKPWKGAEVISKQTFRYGAFEARIRAAKGAGVITPFFLWKDGSEIPGAQWQEQDFEIFGRDGSFQSQLMMPGKVAGEQRTEHVVMHYPSTPAYDRYNTYRMEWTPDSLCFYYNGQLIRKETDQTEFSKLLDPARAEPAQLRVSNWAGDFAWSGAFNSADIPADVYVNWIQTYTYTPGTGPNRSNFTPLWRDDFNTWDSNRWWTANWTFEFAVNDYIPQNAAVRGGALNIALTSEAQAGTFRAVPVDDGLTPPLVKLPDPVAIPGVIKAQEYTTANELTPGNSGDAACKSLLSNVDLQTTNDNTGGVCHIAFTDAGEWLGYPITVQTAGQYDIDLRVASGYGGLHVYLELDGVRVGVPSVVSALGWTSWTDLRFSNVTIPAGAHELKVGFVEGYVNFSSITVTPYQVVVVPPISVPGRLDAANYARFYDLTPGNSGGACASDDLDKETSGDVGGGCNIAWTQAGEWVEYDINVAAAGSYGLSFRVASGFQGNKISASIDGIDVTGPLNVLGIAWQTYSDLKSTPIALTAGNHIVRINFLTDYVNLHHVDLVDAASLPPVQVVGLTATAGNALVDLAWSASAGATEYKVVRGLDTIAVVPTTTYRDLTSLNDVAYTYVIVASNAVGNATSSVAATATPKAPVAPAVPVGLTAVSGNGKVDLTWIAVTDASSYNVYRSIDGINFPLLSNSIGALFTDLTVSNGSQYSYRVTSFNGLESAPSLTVDAAPRGDAPVQVVGLAASAGNAMVDLSWTASAGATGYTILRGVDGAAATVLTVVSVPSYQDLAVANGSTYSYSIVASNVWGDAIASAIVEASPALPQPTVPTALAAVATDASVTLTWLAGANDLTYNIYRSNNGVAPVKIDQTTSLTYLDNNVVNGTEYTYTVTGVNGSLESAPSVSVAATPRGAVPAAVTDLSATTGNSMVSLTWSLSSAATSYKVLRSVGGGAATEIGLSTTGMFTDATVANGTAYTYAVVASNVWGDAPVSASVVATPRGDAPVQVVGLAATASSGLVSLSWTASADAASYKVLRSSAGGAAILVGTSATTLFTDATVVNGTVYTYSVVASNVWGDATASASVEAAPDYPVPGVPTALVAVGGNAKVTLNWVAATNDVTFNIYRASGTAAATKIGTSTTATYTDNTVVNGTEYTYSVTGVNGTKESVPSATAVATPKGVAPVQVIGLVGTAGNAAASLTWTASTGATSYKVMRSVGSAVATLVGTTTTTSFADAALLNGTAYTYSVVASNVWGDAIASSSVVVTPSAPTAKLKAQYKAGSTTATTNGIRPLLQVVNTGTTSIPLSQITVRYWFTNDGTRASTYWCDWAQVGTANVTGTIKTVSPTRTGADRYLEIGFKTTAGNLAGGASTGEIQSRFSKTDWSSFTQTNDASYDPTKAAAFADWAKVTVYLNGTLVWGTEP